MRIGSRALLGGGAIALVAVGALGIWAARSGEESAAADLPPHNGRFHVDCDYSHSAPDDPIVFPGQHGALHQHDFFGATTTDESSTAETLAAGGTTCSTLQDTAAYWAPSLFAGERQIVPMGSTAYYRAAPGVDPTDVQPFPTGLVMISGDSQSTAPQPTDWVGWACRVEGPTEPTPPPCSDTLLLRVIFPDCWDGERLDSVDHREHVARSTADGCPASHPVALPQLEFHVRYPAPPEGVPLHLASGSLLTAHADFFNAWEPEKLAREVSACIGHDAYC